MKEKIFYVAEHKVDGLRFILGGHSYYISAGMLKQDIKRVGLDLSDFTLKKYKLVEVEE